MKINKKGNKEPEIGISLRMEELILLKKSFFYVKLNTNAYNYFINMQTIINHTKCTIIVQFYPMITKNYQIITSY